MKKITDNTLFALIHDYFKIYLPKQRKCSTNTIRAYQIAVESLLDFVKAEKNVRLIDITFEMINRNMLGTFLDELEEKRSWTVSTRNHRLQCICAFYAYAAEIEPMVIACQDDILKVPIAKVDESDIVEHMSESAIKALWEQPNVSTKGMRDQFLMMLLYDSAARIQELLDIKLGDIRLGTPTTLMLNGKGRKVRTVTIMEKTVEYLRDYFTCFSRR